MTPQSLHPGHVLELGDWRVRVLDGGRLSLDGGAMFGSAPRALWERLIVPDERHRIPLAMRLLLLEHRVAGHRVLVDTGIGDKFDERFRDLFDVRNPVASAGSSPLATLLAAHGLAVDDITHVLLTHLHFDHAGGVSIRDGERVVPSFPRAEHFLRRANLAEAEAPNPRERASYLAENVAPLHDTRLTLIDDDAEILPGLRVERSDGHTVGLQTVRVEGGGRVLRYVADVAPTAHHVHLPITMGYDLCSRQLLGEKERLWRAALDEEATIVFEHDAEVALARIAFDGRKYRAEPIAVN